MWKILNYAAAERASQQAVVYIGASTIGVLRPPTYSLASATFRSAVHSDNASSRSNW